MRCGIVLVISLSRVEGFHWNDLGYDRAGEDFSTVELRDVSLGNFLLLLVTVKNYGAILLALVRSLAVQLRGAVRHREKNPQQLPIGEPRRNIHDQHRNGPNGFSRTYHLLLGLLGRPPLVT